MSSDNSHMYLCSRFYQFPLVSISASFIKRLSFTLKVNLNVKQGGKRLEHQGIRIEFVGQIGERPGHVLLHWVYCRNRCFCVTAYGHISNLIKVQSRSVTNYKF